MEMEGKRKAGSSDDINLLLQVQVPLRGLRTRSYPPPFLMKTFEMVEDPETNPIISWSSSNTSFIIWDQISFTTELLHKYFRHNNFSSFVYQLNNYGFKKVSWERCEYENPWFQAGKRHLLSKIKRRNQKNENDIRPQLASDVSSDDLVKDGMQEHLQALISEQHAMKEEIHKLNQHQSDIYRYHLNKLQENMKVAEREKKYLMSQLLARHFIKNMRGMIKNETAKKQKLDQLGCKKVFMELAGEEDELWLNVDKHQEQKDATRIQPGEVISSADNSGSPAQNHQQPITGSEHAENCAFWKQIMEDESECETGKEDQVENHPKKIVKLEDLITSSDLMEGENLVGRGA